VVFVKVGVASMCIEHFGGKWQLKLAAFKGQNLFTAYVPGGCALEACSSRVWFVSEGVFHVPQSSVKMLCGADAEREVSRRSLSALCNAPSVTARAPACTFIITFCVFLKLFRSRRPLKARPMLPLKQNLMMKSKMPPMRRPSLRALWSCCSGWTFRSTSQNSCEGKGG